MDSSNLSNSDILLLSFIKFMLVDELGEDWRRDSRCFDIILLLSKSTKTIGLCYFSHHFRLISSFPDNLSLTVRHYQIQAQSGRLHVVTEFINWQF